MTPANYETFKQWCVFQKDVRATQQNFKLMYDVLIANGFPSDATVPREAWGAAFVATRDQLELRQINTTGVQTQGDSNGVLGRLSHQQLNAIAEADAAKKVAAKNKGRAAQEAEEAFQIDLKRAQSWLDCRNGRIIHGSTEEGQAVRVKAVYAKHKREMPK